MAYYVAFENTASKYEPKNKADEPITVESKNNEIGIYYPVFDNPLDALRFGELFSRDGRYYIREVFVLNGQRQDPV